LPQTISSRIILKLFINFQEEEDYDEFPEEDEIEMAVSGILRDLKKTLSASLRSLSFRSGSLTRYLTISYVIQ
jgi:hypothetical protein